MRSLSSARKGTQSIRSIASGARPRLSRSKRLTLALVSVLVLSSVAAGSASAARDIKTGLADGTFFDPRSSVRNTWFDRADAENIQILRLGVNWSFIAGTKPSNATNPADPAYRWTSLDRAVRGAAARGLDVMFMPNTAPRWAEGANRPAGTQAGSWKPSPGAFGSFGRALATRYSGNFPDPENPGNLPRVDFYEVWNEPNLDFWLAPQFSGGKNTGPDLYRAMHNSFADGVKAVHADNQIVGPALAPFGGVTENKKTRTRPLGFMRKLFCLKGRKKLKPKKRCADKLQIDVVSHHPISVTGPPTQKAFHPDDATAGDMGKVKKVVRKAERGKTILPAGRRPIWVTEYFYRSNPPASAGVPLNKQARWVQQSLYVFWKSGVKLAIYNLIRDRPSFDPENAFGLYFRGGEAKPAAEAFAFPFVTQRKSKKKLLAWGKAPVSGRLKIQRKKGKSWKTVKRLNATEDRVFKKKLRLRGKQKLRARVGDEQSLVWKQKR